MFRRKESKIFRAAGGRSQISAAATNTMLLRTVSKLKCPNFVSPYRRPLSTAITSQLNALASSLPHKDAISYRTAAEAGIVKWTFSDVDRYAGAFAAGLEEASFTTGDALAAWLPPNSAEKLIAQFAADRVGLVLVEVDPALGDAPILHVTETFDKNKPEAGPLKGMSCCGRPPAWLFVRGERSD